MISQLNAAQAEGLLNELAEVLHDCVAGGASVGFMQPFTQEDAASFWRQIIGARWRGDNRIFVARDAQGRLSGTVLLGLDTPPNQPHRAEVKKLLVHRRARRQGLARALMLAAEAEAGRLGRHLLVLDTRHNDSAEPLYRELGYTLFGIIPGYAMPPDGGAPEDCSFHYKNLKPA